MSLINALLMGVVTPQQFGEAASQSLANVYPYRYYSLYLPGTQSGFTRTTRFRLFDETGTNVAASATVTDTVHYGSETGDKATDNDDANQWTMNNGVNGRVVVDFGAPQDIRDFYVGFSTYPNSGNGFRIQGSDDGSTWTTLYDSQLFYGGNSPGWPTATPRRVKNVNRIYEIVFDGTQSAGFRDIGWLDLLDGDDVSILADTNIIEHIDINNAYSGSPGAEYWGNIADRDTATRGTFNITTDDLRIALRVKDAKAAKLSLTRATTGGNAMPSAVTVRYSEDGGTSWSSIYSTSGLSWSAGETKTFTLGEYSSPWITLSSGSGYADSVYRVVGSGGQWYDGSLPISGETGSTFTMTIAKEGADIRYVNSGGVSNNIHCWVPSDLATPLTHWWDARQGVSTSGSNVTEWADAVNGYTASQATGSNRPTFSATARNGYPGITFDGTSHRLAIDNVSALPNGSAAGTTIELGYMNAIGASMLSYGTLANNSRRQLGVSGTGEVQSYFYGGPYDQASGYTWSVSTDNILVERLASGSGAAITWRAEGVQQATGNTNGALTTGTTAGYLGASYDGSLGFWNGTIQSIMVADYQIPDGELVKLEGFLAHAFGATAVLDAGHAHKTTAPRVTV